jgi:hypothetical protein
VPGEADLELSLRAVGGGEYAAEVRVRFPGDAADTHREDRVRLTDGAGEGRGRALTLGR